MRRSTKWALLAVGFVLAVGGPAPTAHAATALASCYGPGLYGNHTANGTVLTTRTLGIAHKTWPLHSRRRASLVVIADRRRAVVVPVIDRGPFVARRDVDVTSATARALGYRSCRSFGVHRLWIWRIY